MNNIKHIIGIMKHRFFVAGVVAALSFIFVSPSLSASSSNLSSENQASVVVASSSSSSSSSSNMSSENQMYAVGGSSKSLLSSQPRSGVGFGEAAKKSSCAWFYIFRAVC